MAGNHTIFSAHWNFGEAQERLKGIARLYTEDASVVNFRIDRAIPEKDRDSNLKRRN